ncbi:MAG: carboxypeptidase-like regulatory domain-containing protein, partial [Bacteroidota bacterium]|nr:carboxypeptidase-like regulatory domain-containing protein [Bacteroidota bacterium]
MILLLIASLHTFQLQAADTINKGERITLNFEGTTLKEVLEIIEDKTPYYFFYNHRAVDVDRKVSLQLSNVSVEVAMRALFNDAEIDWRIRGAQIVLKKNRALKTSHTADAHASPSSTILPLVSHETYSFLSYDLRVSGIVTNEGGEPIPGVNVIIKGTTIGTTTDVNGRYALEISDPNAILVFSFIGFTTQEVNVGNQTTIDVALVSDVTSLEEVVVVGYGTEQRKDLTSAITTVTNKELLPGAFNSPLQMIDGKVAGVTISNPAAGDPNRNADIQVRGAASIDS